MKKRLRAGTIGLVLATVLAGCSGGTGGVLFNPEDLAVSVSTLPTPAMAGQEVEILAEWSGTTIEESARVTTEIRVDDKIKLVDAERMEGDVYRSTFTFPAAGEYDVYFHLYSGDYHLTKKQKVIVE